MELLGGDWAYMITGLSRETTYRERTAFVFDGARCSPRAWPGRSCSGRRQGLPAGRKAILSAQFFRPPLFAGFRCLGSAFTLVNQHIVFGEQAERGRDRGLTRWLAEVHPARSGSAT